MLYRRRSRPAEYSYDQLGCGVRSVSRSSRRAWTRGRVTLASRSPAFRLLCLARASPRQPQPQRWRLTTVRGGANGAVPPTTRSCWQGPEGGVLLGLASLPRQLVGLAQRECACPGCSLPLRLSARANRNEPTALLDLALWKAPQQSGAVLVAATGFYFVFEKLQYTLLALVAQALLVAVLGCAIWTTFCRFTNRRALAALALSTFALKARQAHTRGAQAGGVRGSRTLRGERRCRRRQRPARAGIQAGHGAGPEAFRAGTQQQQQLAKPHPHAALPGYRWALLRVQGRRLVLLPHPGLLGCVTARLSHVPRLQLSHRHLLTLPPRPQSRSPSFLYPSCTRRTSPSATSCLPQPRRS